MKIRKKYRVESAHIVRNCTSYKCAQSIHGHSAVVEVFLESRSLDEAQMVYDFALMNNGIKEFVDAMDHCYLLCAREDERFKGFIKESCARWIELPFNMSAEMLSVFVMWGVRKVLEATSMANGEQGVVCTGIRYHETDSGWAECDEVDLQNLFLSKRYDTEIVFSRGVLQEWSRPTIELFCERIDTKFINPEVPHQIKL